MIEDDITSLKTYPFPGCTTISPKLTPKLFVLNNMFFPDGVTTPIALYLEV